LRKAVEKAAAYARTDAHTPILGELCRAILRVGENCDVFATHDKDFSTWFGQYPEEVQYPQEDAGWMQWVFTGAGFQATDDFWAWVGEDPQTEEEALNWLDRAPCLDATEIIEYQGDGCIDGVPLTWKEPETTVLVESVPEKLNDRKRGRRRRKARSASASPDAAK
jgi:hypothetical protein